MNRKQYEDELHHLLSDGQALSQRIRILMSQFEETANCREWNMLGQVVMSVGTANDALFTALYPRPSALIDADA